MGNVLFRNGIHCFKSFLFFLFGFFKITTEGTCYTKSILLVNRRPKLEFPLRVLQLTMKYLVDTLITWQYLHDSYMGLWCTMKINSQESYKKENGLSVELKEMFKDYSWWFIVLITLDDLSKSFKGHLSSFIEYDRLQPWNSVLPKMHRIPTDTLDLMAVFQRKSSISHGCIDPDGHTSTE